jgi:hypothetical protein
LRVHQTARGRQGSVETPAGAGCCSYQAAFNLSKKSNWLSFVFGIASGNARQNARPTLNLSLAAFPMPISRRPSRSGNEDTA